MKHCVTCGSGTDALTLALKALNIGAGDAVFVPDFTFFASGETPALEGATPVFVDVEKETFNLSAESLRQAVEKVKEEGKLVPKAVIAVDLFGLPADYPKNPQDHRSVWNVSHRRRCAGIRRKNRREKSVQFRGHFRYFFFSG